MTILEATVEIVKTAILPSSGGNSSSFITADMMRINLINGIEAIYKKLSALESGK